MSDIHKFSVIDDTANIGDGCIIGAFSVIGPNVTLGAGVRVHTNAVVTGRTTIGPGSEIFPFASIGHKPQDLKFKGEPSTLTIGANCI